MLDDTTLMESVDSLILNAHDDLETIVNHLWKHHWNGNIGEKESIMVALADFTRRYSGFRHSGEEIGVSLNTAFGQVLQNPNVQKLVDAMIKRRGGVQ